MGCFHTFLPVTAPIISGPHAWRSHFKFLHGCYWIHEGTRLDFYSIVLHPEGIKDLTWYFVGLWINLCISIFIFLNCRCPQSSIALWHWGDSRSWCWLKPPENWHLLSLDSDVPEVRSQHRDGVVTSTDRSQRWQHRIKIKKILTRSLEKIM